MLFALFCGYIKIHRTDKGGEMPEDNSTTVSEESTTQKSLLKRLFGLYEIIPFLRASTWAGVCSSWQFFWVWRSSGRRTWKSLSGCFSSSPWWLLRYFYSWNALPAIRWEKCRMKPAKIDCLRWKNIWAENFKLFGQKSFQPRNKKWDRIMNNINQKADTARN